VSRSRADTLRLDVSGTGLLVDEAPHVRVEGAVPHSPVTITAEVHIPGTGNGRSAATYVSDADGCVDLGRDAPLSGAYAGVDKSGLLWSADVAPAVPTTGQLDPVVTTLAAENTGRRAQAAVSRAVLADGVVREPLDHGGLYGALFHNGSPRPGVVVVGGSEGGLQETYAALLASRGFTTLALAYFRAPSLPAELSMIPLEYVERALGWFRARPVVAGGPEAKVAMVGWSKGGELALLSAATFPDAVGAVVGIAPAGVAFMGIGRRPPWVGAFRQSSWSYRDAPVPFVPMRMTPKVVAHMTLSRGPVTFKTVYDAALENHEAAAAAEIAVERVGGPVLLLSGDADRMWPAAELCERAVARARRHRARFPIEHRSHAGAGHGVRLPTMPPIVTIPRAFMGRPLDLGGTAEANARAGAEGWPVILDFLRESAEHH